jgi:FHA domain
MTQTDGIVANDADGAADDAAEPKEDQLSAALPVPREPNPRRLFASLSPPPPLPPLPVATDVAELRVLSSHRDRDGLPGLRCSMPLVDGTELFVGRSHRCNHLILPDPRISRQHLRFLVRDGGCAMVEDLSSRGGTFLNGQVLRAFAPVELRHGDVITFARTSIQFVHQADEPPVPSPLCRSPIRDRGALLAPPPSLTGWVALAALLVLGVALVSCAASAVFVLLARRLPLNIP